MRALQWVLIGGLLLGACSAPMPTQTPTASTVVDCQLGTVKDCDLALGIANVFLLQKGLGVPARTVVIWGRAPALTWHAEAHACFGDGRYLLIDAIGPISGSPTASLRQSGWTNPPCR